MKKILNSILENKFPLIIFWILSLVPFFWYKKGFVIAGADMVFPIDLHVYFERGITLWNESINTGVSYVKEITRLPEFMIIKILSLMGFQLDLLEIILFCFIFFGILYSFYFMSIQILIKEEKAVKTIASTIGAVFYLFNFFSITRWEGGDRPIIYLMITIPLIIGFTLRNKRKESLFNYFSLGIATFLFSYSVVNPPSFIAGFFIIFLFYLFQLVLIFRLSDKNEKKRNYFRLIKEIIIMIIFNLYWIVLFLRMGSISDLYNEISPSNWLEGLSQNTTFVNVIRLMGAWYWYDGWGGNWYAPYAQIYRSNNYFIFLTFLVPIFCFLGLAFYFRKRKGFFLSIILLLGIVFSMGTNGPFGSFYKFLYNNSIIFKSFRSPWFKFSLYTIMGYSFFYGIFSSSIISFFRNKNLKILSNLIYLLLFAFPIILCHPLITAPFFKSQRVSIPEYIKDSIKFFENNMKEGERVFALPSSVYEDYKWGYNSISPVFPYLTKIPFVYESFPTDPTNSFTKIVNMEINSGNFSKASEYLAVLGVKTILNRKDLSSYSEASGKNLDKILNEQKEFIEIEKIGDWELYQRKEDVLPLFWKVSKLINIQSLDLFGEAAALVSEKRYVFSSGENNILGYLNSYYLVPENFISDNKGNKNFIFSVIEDAEYDITIETDNYDNNSITFFLDNIPHQILKKNDNFNLKITLGKGEHTISFPENLMDTSNLIKNGDFSNQTVGWETFNEGTYYALPEKSTLDIFGKNRVRIKALNASIGIKQEIDSLKNGKYRLTFNFESLDNLPLYVSISSDKQNKKYIESPDDNVFFSKKPTYKRIDFTIKDISQIRVNFYAKVTSIDPNTQLIKDITLSKINGVDQVKIVPVIKSHNKDITYKKVSPTEYELTFFSNEPSWVIFNASYNKSWIALEANKQLNKEIVNNFANAFFVPSKGEHKIRVVFKEKLVLKTVICFSVILLLSFVITHLILNRKFKYNIF